MVNGQYLPTNSEMTKFLQEKNYNYRTQSTWSTKYVVKHISVQNTSKYEIR